MTERYVQLVKNDEYIGVYKTGLTDIMIERLYQQYLDDEDYGDFDEYVEDKHPDYPLERVFLDEIYV